MEGDAEAVAAARWARAEDTLYASLVSDPDTYERVVGLVATLLDHLRVNVHDRAGLVAASERGADLIAEVSPESLVPWMAAEPALSAACAVRARELSAATERQKRASTLAQARRCGQSWARIERSSLGMGSMVGPVAMVHLRSATAVDSVTGMDPDTGLLVFSVRAVRVDPDTGDIVGDVASLGPHRTAATVAERDVHVAELQSLIERLDTENHLV